jgi:hypothetical protein
MHPNRCLHPIVVLLSLSGAVAHADTITLASSNPLPGGRFGDAVACIGDVNADGYNDVIVGAPVESTPGASGAGRARIFSGRTGLAIRTHVSPTPIASGNFGQCVIGFPDLNGDGVEDYGIGAPGEASQLGRFYLYSGASGTVLYNVSGLAPRTFTSIALVPDCTGDGLPEMVAGVFGNLTSTPVEVREARNGVLWKSLVDPTRQNLSLFGTTVGGVPDVTGDGRGDVLVGAERQNASRGGPVEAGRAYLYDGATGALWATLTSHDPSTSGHFGQALVGLPDIDGDGRGDVAVGAPIESAANGFDGRVHLHSGATGSWIRTILSADPAPSPLTSGEFGFAISACGDLDGDGITDIVVGAPEEVPASGKTGRAYAYSSANGGLIAIFDSPGSLVKRFGHAIDASRDVNGDGSPDVVVGAPDAASGAAGATGFAYLYRLVPGDGCTVDAPPIPITDGEHPFTTVGGGNDFPPATLCGSEAQFFAADVFFEYTSSCTGTLTIGTCGTADFNTVIALYEGCGYFGGAIPTCDPEHLIACNDNGQGCPGLTSSLSVPTVAGTCYRVRIGGATQGSGTFSVQCAAACPADLDHDGTVGAPDLALLLGAWGAGGPADLDGSGTVGSADLAILLGAWGGC